MILLPDFTEEKGKTEVLYFSAEGKDPQKLLRELENTYACYSAAGTVQKNGVTYVALEIDADGDLPL